MDTPCSNAIVNSSSSKCALTVSLLYCHAPPYPSNVPAFACEDAGNPVTRADGEHGERGESSSELGVATFAAAVPAKFYFIYMRKNLNALQLLEIFHFWYESVEGKTR